MRTSTSQRSRAPAVQLARAPHHHRMRTPHHAKRMRRSAHAATHVVRRCAGWKECASHPLRHAKRRKTACNVNAPRTHRCNVNAPTRRAQPRTRRRAYDGSVATAKMRVAEKKRCDNRKKHDKRSVHAQAAHTKRNQHTRTTLRGGWVAQSARQRNGRTQGRLRDGEQRKKCIALACRRCSMHDDERNMSAVCWCDGLSAWRSGIPTAHAAWNGEAFGNRNRMKTRRRRCSFLF